MSTTRLQVTLQKETIDKVKGRLQQKGLRNLNVQGLVEILLVKVADEGFDSNFNITESEEEKRRKWEASLPTYKVNQETEKEISEALEDLKHGRYVNLHSLEEINEYFDKLDLEENE